MKRFLGARKGAYCRVFAKDNQDAQAVLADLAKFCRASETTFHPNSDIAKRLDGRREVFLRIGHHLNLDDETLWRLYCAANPTKGSE